uniref:Uncharacterized protein n=1 Tax=viral metagenome TaxID=1070528 RepID=A0A6C0CDJ9_9ZZZZ
MGRRVKRKNTRRISRRVNRKNTMRKNTRRVNRKNTRRLNRKKTRRVNRKNTKLFGGANQQYAEQRLMNDIIPKLRQARENKTRRPYDEALNEFNDIKGYLDDDDYDETMGSFKNVDQILINAGK